MHLFNPPRPPLSRSRSLFRRTTAAIASTAVLATGLLAANVAGAPTAYAAEQSGYVFNDVWSLTGPSTETQYSPGMPARGTATSALPTRTGTVGVSAEFVENSERNAGGSVLTDGTNQGAYNAGAGMFTGSPTPATCRHSASTPSARRAVAVPSTPRSTRTSRASATSAGSRSRSTAP